MGREIERKFLVLGDAWRWQADKNLRSQGVLCIQGYLNSNSDRIVRVRVMGKQAFLTVKGRAEGIVRPEFEYEIPLADACFMLDNLAERPLIEKRRYKIPVDGFTWEVDEFLGVNQGLVVAEIELADENQTFTKPSWVGREVTDDPRYLNANLVACPFVTWKKA